MEWPNSTPTLPTESYTGLQPRVTTFGNKNMYNRQKEASSVRRLKVQWDRIYITGREEAEKVSELLWKGRRRVRQERTTLFVGVPRPTLTMW